MLSSIFDAFAEESPISIMMRGLMERVFSCELLDAIFAEHSKLQCRNAPEFLDRYCA